MKPIKTNNFGDFSNPGKQFVFNAWFEGQGSSETAYAIKQTGTNQFHLVSEVDPSLSARFRLGNGAPTGPGEAQLVVTPFGGAPESAKKVQSHIVITHEGRAYTWKLNTPASTAGEADITTSW